MEMAFKISLFIGTTMITNKAIILCSPRVASRFFADAFQKATGENIEKTHSPAYPFLDQYQIIGIVRDPLDTIASEVAMGHFLHNTPISDEINIESFVKRYIDTNKAILEKAKIIIMYDDLAKDVSSVVKKATSKINIEKPEYPNYTTDRKIEDVIDPINGYLVSSKTYKNYSFIKDKVLQHDLCEAYEIYQAAVEISRN